jgi:hypothetical protein
MTTTELAHLELLAEIDTLVDRLRNWAENAPPWTPAENCRALVRRLVGRAAALRIRLDAPLVVATLGGTGTGKSALVNALAGGEVVQTGRQRPTTVRPTLVCRPDITPELLGIGPQEVDVVQRDLPGLAQLVLVDCPDPDTSEPIEGPADTNLARLRRILPFCDVILVTTTQQKYRSARVAEELATAAPGARPVFVETHADRDDDIRDDWRQTLSGHFLEHRTPDHIFLVDSIAALARSQTGHEPQGEFAALVDLLTRQFAGAAATRIRRANFLDLSAQTLESCRSRLDQGLGPVRQVQAAIDQQRGQLAARLAGQMQAELLSSRRPWESRLLGQVTSRWGLSPFSLVLRMYQGLGTLAAGALLYRARSPAQLALWGTVQGARAWQRRRQDENVRQRPGRLAAGGWDPTELRASAMVLEGYAAEADLPRSSASSETIATEADRAGVDFAARLSQDLDALIARQAERHTGWFTRGRYEFLLLAMLGVLLYRLGKNFFYDSWLAPAPVPVWGLESYVAAGFWLVLWCFLLLWAFTRRLRRGLRQAIGQLAEGWTSMAAASGIFGRLESDCRRAEQFRQDLDRLTNDVQRLRNELHQG